MPKIDQETITRYLRIQQQMSELSTEIRALSNKKPDGAVNTFKLGLVNSILKDANDILGAAYRPFESFEVFDSDEMPSNSDLLVMLTQYLKMMEQFRSDHSYLDTSLRSHWYISDDDEEENEDEDEDLDDGDPFAQ